MNYTYFNILFVAYDIYLVFLSYYYVYIYLGFYKFIIK